MKRLILISVLALALTGCGTYYSYEGKVYHVTAQGEFGQMVDGNFIPLEDDDLLQRAARDGTQHNSVGTAQDDADDYNRAELIIAESEAARKSEEEDSKGD